jgi:hypothetical protein
MPEHIDVSGDELLTLVKAFNGFKEQVVFYSDAREGKGKKRRKGNSKK